VWALHAKAFEYPEHAAFTATAVRHILNDPQTNENQFAKKFLEQIRFAIGNARKSFCARDEDFFTKADYDEWPQRCFALADVTGLAGDFSSSPQNLVFRFFNEKVNDGRADPSRLQFEYSRIQGLLSYFRAHDQERTVTRPVVAANFLCSVRTSMFEPLVHAEERCSDSPSGHPTISSHDAERCLHNFRTWNRETALSSRTDNDFGVLAANNLSHFRNLLDPSNPDTPDLGKQRIDLAARRVHFWYSTDENHRPIRSKPEQSAWAYYADLHLGALAYASASRKAPSAQDAETMQGTATLLELYALHFLQDALAPGHSFRGSRPPRFGHSRDRLHRCLNELGFLSEIPPEACGTAMAQDGNYPLLAIECRGSPSPKIQLFGDGQVYCHRGLSVSEKNATGEYAVLVSESSIREVLDAALGNVAFATEITDLVTTPESRENRGVCWPLRGEIALPSPDQQALVNHLCNWWEGYRGDDQVDKRTAWIAEYASRFGALSLVLEPLGGPTPDRAHSQCLDRH
jgi:hypothetical protein